METRGRENCTKVDPANVSRRKLKFPRVLLIRGDIAVVLASSSWDEKKNEDV